MWVPGVCLLIWGWQLKREHFKCRDWSKSSPQTGEGRRVSKGKFISKTGWGAGAEERWVDVKTRGSRNQVNETHYDLLGMFNLKLWSLQLLKMVQLKGKQFHCDRAGRTREMFDIQMPFKKKKKRPLFQSSCFASGEMHINFSSFIMNRCVFCIFFMETRGGYPLMENGSIPSPPCTIHSNFSSWP